MFAGMKDDDEPEDPEFGRKFLGVKAGGTLEIHGKDKLSWTKLTKTVVPHDIIFSTEDEQPSTSGVIFYEFDRQTGERISETRCIKHKHVKNFLKDISSASVVAIVSR